MRGWRRASGTRGGGFTLTELLIVLAMLALLAGILLPALGAARAKSRESQCMSQLHQIGKAFQMYLDDYGNRPPRLYNVWPQYVSAPRIFVCPSDHWVGQGGWGWAAWGKFGSSARKWPFPISYGYFFGRYVDAPTWRWAREAPGRPGYVVCVLHGEVNPRSRPGPGRAPYFRGRTLRLCFDGGVIVRNVDYGHVVFNTWKAMTDEEKPPGAP